MSTHKFGTIFALLYDIQLTNEAICASIELGVEHTFGSWLDLHIFLGHITLKELFEYYDKQRVKGLMGKLESHIKAVNKHKDMLLSSHKNEVADQGIAQELLERAVCISIFFEYHLNPSTNSVIEDTPTNKNLFNEEIERIQIHRNEILSLVKNLYSFPELEVLINECKDITNHLPEKIYPMFYLRKL